MQSFKPLFDQGHLAMVQAAGSPDTTRSHFDAQDFMESGTPGVKATPDGWLNRALQAEDLRRPATHTAFRAVALGSQVPRTLEGKISAVAVNRVQDFSVAGKNPNAAPISSAFEAMYADSVDSVLHGTGQETFEAVKMLKAADPAHYKPGPGRELSQWGFRRQYEADCPAAEGESGCRSSVHRHRWLGYAPESGQRERTAGQLPARLQPGNLSFLDRYGQRCGERSPGDHGPSSGVRRNRTVPVEPITGMPMSCLCSAAP